MKVLTFKAKIRLHVMMFLEEPLKVFTKVFDKKMITFLALFRKFSKVKAKKVRKHLLLLDIKRFEMHF